jgi:hypothetical protein
MISVLASSTVDRGFEPRSGQTTDYKIGATCLPADCCFGELALYKSNSACCSSTKRTSSSSHWKLTCSRHDIAEKLLNLRYATITHSLLIPKACYWNIDPQFLIPKSQLTKHRSSIPNSKSSKLNIDPQFQIPKAIKCNIDPQFLIPKIT